MHPIRGGFRDEQAAPECRGCCKTSCPHWRLEVSCSPPGKHQSLLGGTCQCCGPGGIHSILPGFSPGNLPAKSCRTQSLGRCWHDISPVSSSPGSPRELLSSVFGHSTTALPLPPVCGRLMCQISPRPQIRELDLMVLVLSWSLAAQDVLWLFDNLLPKEILYS